MAPSLVLRSCEHVERIGVWLCFPLNLMRVMFQLIFYLPYLATHIYIPEGEISERGNSCAMGLELPISIY